MSPEEAALLTYDTHSSKFDSVYERNKFYRGLFGYKQTVTKNGKEYNYEKGGLMDEISCIRIDDSVFIFGKKNQEKVEKYFSDWGEKVTHRIFTVIVEDPQLIEKLRK